MESYTFGSRDREGHWGPEMERDIGGPQIGEMALGVQIWRVTLVGQGMERVLEVQRRESDIGGPDI